MTQPQPEKSNEDDGATTVHVDWSDAANAPAAHANQFIAQVGPPTESGMPDGVYLTFGHIPPPLVISKDPEMRQREIEVLKAGIQVEVLGRFHFSRERLAELIKVLQTTVENFDRAAVVYQQRKSGGGAS